MAEGSSNTPGPFDVPTIKALISMMSRHDISEIDLREGNQRIRLLRGGKMVPVETPRELILPPTASAPAQPTPAPSDGDSPSSKEKSKPLYEIKSPTPGTFYAASSPEADPFVKVGSKVNNDTVVCLIEAMKLFTEITADVSGVIAEILVQNQQPVEFGTVLFRVDTSG